MDPGHQLLVLELLAHPCHLEDLEHLRLVLEVLEVLWLRFLGRLVILVCPAVLAIPGLRRLH